METEKMTDLPPSAPVGVDEVVRKVCERLDKVADYAHTIDGETVVVALSNLPAALARALSEALAQQPADKARAAAYRDCCDTPAYCSSVRRCTAKDGKQPDAVAGLVEAINSVVREMDCDEKGKPYVYTQPSMVIWTEKWRGLVKRLRDAAALATQHQEPTT